ncbi:hypothetical protein ACFWUZ_30470 [Streptomyces sp. NPDC058646]|uniref:hypothetical protein n=1 Tax=Streptomyces sp. NPDC058646 TaxID=3346574 RepID=UPI0036597D22
MIRSVSGPPRRRQLTGFLVLLLLGAVCWYGLQPVPLPDCVVYHGAYVPDGPNGPSGAERVEQVLREVPDAPACRPKPRWETWGFSI